MLRRPIPAIDHGISMPAINTKLTVPTVAGFMLTIAASSLSLAASAAESDAGTDLPWSLSVGAGGQFTDDSSGGEPYGSFTLQRSFGKNSFSAGFNSSKSNPDSTASSNNVPTRVYQGTLGYGRQFGDYAFESHLSFGARHFGAQAQNSSSGSQHGAGFSVSRSFGSSDQLQYTPYIGLDWNRAGTLTQQKAAGGDTSTVSSQNSKGATGTLGLTLTHDLSIHNTPAHLSGGAAFLVASNGSAFSPNASSDSATSGSNGHQNWGQLTGGISFDLSDRTTLGFNLARTLGFEPADNTTAGVTLNYSF